MTTPTISQTAVTANLARVFGLRAGNAIDEKLARAILNPKSACVERFIYSRGLCALYVGGMYLDSVGEAGRGARALAEFAEKLPEIPHLKDWATKL